MSMPRAMVLAAPAVLRVPATVALISWWLLIRRRTPLDDLVQLTPVQPNASAVGAIVDFHALSVSHKKPRIALRAWHPFDLSTFHFDLHLASFGQCRTSSN